jgi:hypothetical protein
MYSKLFSSILDSSIWLEDAPTVKVWITFLAAKDRDGFARFAALENLSRRAIVSLDEAAKAVAILEAPDPRSSNPEHEGRRIERVPGGWVVLNAKIYDDMVRQEDERSATRERVARHRERKRQQAKGTTDSDSLNAEVLEAVDQLFDQAWKAYPSRGDHGNPRAPALKAWRARIRAGVDPAEIIAGVERYAAFVRAKGNEGSEFVKQASTFFGPSKFWLEPWKPPTRNGTSRESRNDAEIDRFARGE